MPFTEKEKLGAEIILELISDEEVLSLSKTVTKDQIHISTREEATSAILAYSSCPTELLRRKKVKREVLFQYLYREKVTDILPSADKSAIIQRILTYWDSAVATQEYLQQDEDDSLLVRPTLPNEEPRRQYAEDFNCWLDHSLRSTEEDQSMALQFSKWFYPMLNTCNPDYNQATTPDNFGVQHFFGDCILLMKTVMNSEERVEHFNSSNLVVDRLAALVRDERLIMNPNVETAGLKGLSDVHGRKIVIVCGTIHRQSDFLGVFEQQFGLVRDPTMNNNWKIKFSRLALSASSLPSLPTLDVTRRMLTSH